MEALSRGLPARPRGSERASVRLEQVERVRVVRSQMAAGPADDCVDLMRWLS